MAAGGAERARPDLQAAVPGAGGGRRRRRRCPGGREALPPRVQQPPALTRHGPRVCLWSTPTLKTTLGKDFHGMVGEVPLKLSKQRRGSWWESSHRGERKGLAVHPSSLQTLPCSPWDVWSCYLMNWLKAVLLAVFWFSKWDPMLKIPLNIKHYQVTSKIPHFPDDGHL